MDQQNEPMYSNLEEILNTLNEGVMILNTDGKITHLNQSAEKIIGLPQIELIGKTAFPAEWEYLNEQAETISEDELPGNIALRENTTIQHYILGMKNPEGKIIWLSINALPMTQGSQEEQLLLTFLDITDRRESESYNKQLEEELFRVSLAAKQTTNPVILTDVQKK